MLFYFQRRVYIGEVSFWWWWLQWHRDGLVGRGCQGCERPLRRVRIGRYQLAGRDQKCLRSDKHTLCDVSSAIFASNNCDIFGGFLKLMWESSRFYVFKPKACVSGDIGNREWQNLVLKKSFWCFVSFCESSSHPDPWVLYTCHFLRGLLSWQTVNKR